MVQSWARRAARRVHGNLADGKEETYMETVGQKERELFELADRIDAVDRGVMEKAARRQACLAKPPGSLGGLEEISIRMAGITGEVLNAVQKGCVVVLCADNGVADEKVASAPQSVTMAQTVNFTRRLTGVGALSESFGSELLIVDMGVKHPIPKQLYDKIPLRDTRKILDRRVRAGTKNLAKEPAMTKAEALRCIDVGLEMAKAVKDHGFDIVGVGEMGIGNTTTSAAILSAVTGKDSGFTCGKGGGINAQSYRRKKEIVDAVSEAYRRQGGLLAMMEACGAGGGQSAVRAVSGNYVATQGQAAPEITEKGAAGSYGRRGSVKKELAASPGGAQTVPGIAANKLMAADEKRDGVAKETAACGVAAQDGGIPCDLRSGMIDILARMGGFDICAMAGVFIGAALYRLPAVIDGYISAVAALSAGIIAPKAIDYMFASHKSWEKGYELAIQQLGLKPFLALDMRLGEGSGCPIAFDIIKGACDVMRNMATFAEAEINDDYLEEIRKGDCF